ncbi:ABC transporter permease [Erysipelotrichaceae bacterium OttesenSCG-928-M19]|nr:ABC transporter permease [Erysipelotrichaceae bacterium OttesenSCG-928-M19]
MSKTIFKILIRKIFNAKAQFLSLIAISAVGVAMYVGILSVPTSMQSNAQVYLENQNTSDLDLNKVTGFTKKDLKKIKKKHKNIELEKSITLEATTSYKDQEIITRLHSNQEINKPYLIKGKEITKVNDCLVDNENEHLYGKDIKIKALDQTKKCHVVGVIYSPSYLSIKTKGYSSLSTGQVKLILYTHPDKAYSFVEDIPFIEPYNTLSIVYPDKQNKQIFSEDYRLEINKKEKEIKNLFDKDEITIISRDDNQSIDGFYNDSSKIREIGAIFPVIFFLVAAMVGSSTMSRMIEDERMQLGVLSATGYSKAAITSIYIIYALLAVVIGCALGILIGFSIIPTAVIIAYHVLYQLPPPIIFFDFDISLQAIIIAIVMIVGSTLLVALHQIKDNCATLLRPKAPLAGKKIFLEKIRFIWTRLSFINKVSTRNVFRYKKRLFMTILAIMGCSGLLMTGLGIRTSVAPIVDKQFDEIYQYDMIAYNTNLNETEVNKELKKLSKIKNLDSLIATNRQNAIAYQDKDEYDLVVLMANDADKLNDYIKFDQEFTDNDIVITQKLAADFNLKAGSKFKVEIDDKEYTFKISGITTQYVGNFLYINKDVYQEHFNKVKYNSFLIKHHGSTSEITKQLEKQSYFTMIDDDTIYQDTIGDSINGINQLVYIMIAFAGILVIIVMYSLTSINLIERRRELATLKVLGFYNREVSNYVLKENISLTIIGLFIGLIFGKYLHIYIISMVEVTDISFIMEQPPINYFLTFGITLLFSLTVNLVMQRKIKKIDMVDSLKSVE